MVRICIIGAGPSGMSAVYWLAKMDPVPDFVCYEKQDTWGGQWNYSWRTGTDGYGEPNHNGMYRYLWSNGPKECLEYPDYTFKQHFKKAIPSFPPRAVLRNYLEGRWQSSRRNLKQFMRFSHVVRNVQYRPNSDDFVVTVENLAEQERFDEIFSHVIVAVGIFNVPDVPFFPGLETFKGRALHSHDFRDGHEFKGQTVLIIGSSFSAEDIALQCYKFGAKNVIISWRTQPMGLKWPNSITERPILQRLDGNMAYFKDDSSAEIESLIFCTGYKYRFPFMDNSLRLRCERSLYPDDLYKGTLWMKGGNNRVFYLGVQDQYYSFFMFDAQALWACKYITGKLKNEPQSRQHMEQDIKKWRAKNEAIHGYKGSIVDHIDFQADFVKDLCIASGYDERCCDTKPIFYAWDKQRMEDTLTHRNKTHKSVFTHQVSSVPKPWLETLDDSMEACLNNSPVQ